LKWKNDLPIPPSAFLITTTTHVLAPSYHQSLINRLHRQSMDSVTAVVNIITTWLTPLITFASPSFVVHRE